MKVSKKMIFFAFITFALISIIIIAHGMGLDADLKELIESEDAFGPESYETLYTQFVLLLVYILVALILLMMWGVILDSIQPRVTKTAFNTLRVLGRMVIVPFCIIAYLNSFPAFQGTLLGLSAIFGAAIGFASTNTIGNFLAGLYIMAARPFLIGDYIILPDSEGIEGRVKEITVNYTKITLPTGNIVLISNGEFLTQSIINTRTSESKLFHQEETKRIFVYPLKWATNSDEKHKWSTEAIEKTGEEFQERLLKPITWFVSSRTRLDTTYQINLTVNSATKLLDLTGDFMTKLSLNYDEVKEKYQT
ncbi:MAG: mechanosensitive ion channel family protein [Candidatus Heimdallarchaeota archaeon]|nr:MAG: mechanosensitive ion channel family protein [Candidatus Heimdallarchaeota archaeon]